MIEVICNDRLGKKIRVKCNPDDTVGDLKKLLAAQTGTRPEKLATARAAAAGARVHATRATAGDALYFGPLIDTHAGRVERAGRGRASRRRE